MKGTAPAEGLSPSVQDRGATCELWLPTRSRLSRGTRERHCAGCLSGGGETRKLAARARRAALVLFGLRTMKGYCTGGRPLSFGARPWCDVRAVASNAQPAFAWHARERHCAGCLSGGGETRELAARARRAALAVVGLRIRRVLHRREASLFRCKTVVRRASCDLQRAAGIRVARAQAPLRWLSLGRWRNTRACRARAPCRAGCDRTTHYERALHRRKASLFRCKTVVRRASCDLQRAAGIRVARERAPLRWLSLGRWRNTRACRARAPCRAGCDRPTHYERALHRRKASLFRCKTVVRRASCDLQRAAGIRVARERAPLRWLSLGRWRNTRACRARAPCRAGCGRSTHYERALHRRKASLLRCKTVVRRASCELQRAAGIRVAREQAPLRWLSLGRWRNTRACRARAPCRAGCDRLTHLERVLHRRKASLFRRKTVVRRASCDLQRAAGIRVARERAPLRWLSLGRWRNTRACRARAPCRAGCDRPTHYGRVLHRREASLFRCKTVVRRASCDLQRAAGIRVARDASATALAVSREVAKHASLPRARAVPRWL